MKIHWHLDLPEGETPQIRSFDLDEAKSWKGSLIRGHDVAEMIAHEFWEAEAICVRKLYITSPAPFAGEFEVAPNFEPTFIAKQILTPEEAMARVKVTKRH